MTLDEQPTSTADEADAPDTAARPWPAIVRLAVSHRRRFLLVVLLAAVGTAAELVEPLIYRIAVNDVAGVFVQRAGQGGVSGPAAETSRSDGGHLVYVAQTPAEHRHGARESHRRGYVAPRTVQQMFETLVWAVCLLFLTSVAAHAFAVLADNVAAATANRIEEEFIRTTFGHVLRLPLGFFSKRASGALAKRIDQSDQIAPILLATAKDFLPEALRVVGTFAIMVTQSPLLTAVALPTLPLYLLFARQSAKKLETDLGRYFSLWEEVSARIRDAIAAVKTVKLCGAETREVGQFTRVSHAAYQTYLARNRLANRYSLVQSVLTQLGKALVFGFGGWKVLSHQLTPGDVVMFVAYMDRLYDPIDSLTSLAKTVQEHLASFRRALPLLTVDAEEARGDRLPLGPGRVEFRDVCFAYVPERQVLRGVTFTIEAGMTTALVGPSGAGKTTLTDLLLRLYTPSAGAIFIDGQPLAACDPAALREAVTVVAADGALFRGTLADNIRYRCPTASDDRVHAAALAAGLDKTLARLPQGLATEVGEGGVGLSVGERQRLQLARALVAEPRLLVLDEATANLDYVTESEVKQALARTRRGRTTLVVTHRYSMVEDADRVVVLDDGRVIESGTPAQLIARGGWFAAFAARGAQDPRTRQRLGATAAPRDTTS